MVLVGSLRIDDFFGDDAVKSREWATAQAQPDISKSQKSSRWKRRRLAATFGVVAKCWVCFEVYFVIFDYASFSLFRNEPESAQKFLLVISAFHRHCFSFSAVSLQSWQNHLHMRCSRALQATLHRWDFFWSAWLSVDFNGDDQVCKSACLSVMILSSRRNTRSRQPAVNCVRYTAPGKYSIECCWKCVLYMNPAF